MTHSIYSQVISTTKEQKKRIDEIFTPVRIIEFSKGLSNETRQGALIDSLERENKGLRASMVKLILEHKNTLIEIAKAKDDVKESVVAIDKIDKELSKLKFIQRFHLDATFEVPQFKFENSRAGLDLMYDFKIFDLGFRGEASPVDNKFTFNYFLKLKYRFF